MFGLFKKKESAPPIRDLVWISDAAKKHGALALIDAAENLVIAGWFDETIQEWQSFFEAQSRSFYIQSVPYLQALDVKDVPVFLLEHYPLASRETKAMHTWKPKDMVAFVSLEDPLLQLFGGDNLIALVKKMGLGETETLEHKMISRSIRNAQEKLDKSVVHEQLADSQQSWFAANAKKAPY
ncbi:MAG: hypothetical protein SH848_06355 [Saprospiraceae bacterium]|nr:hypothetical protein [Saprospiraceae bacterium]MDZ4703529.1 hypothetical protein [Saprospiraceae bacterium]